MTITLQLFLFSLETDIHITLSEMTDLNKMS